MSPRYWLELTQTQLQYQLYLHFTSNPLLHSSTRKSSCCAAYPSSHRLNKNTKPLSGFIHEDLVAFSWVFASGSSALHLKRICTVVEQWGKAHLLPSLLCVLSFARYNVTHSMDNDWGRMCGEFGLFLTFCPVPRTYWRWVTITGASVSFLSVYTLQLVRFVWLWQPKSSSLFYRVDL